MKENPKNSHIAQLVVWFLGLIGMIGIIGLMLLTYAERKIDGGLIAVVSGVVGALGAMLANPSNRSRQNDEPVPVTNAPGEALDVQETEANAPIPGSK